MLKPLPVWLDVLKVIGWCVLASLSLIIPIRFGLFVLYPEPW